MSGDGQQVLPHGRTESNGSGDAFQTLRHEDGRDNWTWCHGALRPRLRGRVVSCAGFEIRTAVEQTRREVPIPRVPLIISLDGAVELDGAGGSRRVTSFVCGPDDGQTMTGLGTRWAGLQIDLTPPAAAAILGLPLTEVAREVVPLEDLLGPEAPTWRSGSVSCEPGRRGSRSFRRLGHAVFGRRPQPGHR